MSRANVDRPATIPLIALFLTCCEATGAAWTSRGSQERTWSGGPIPPVWCFLARGSFSFPGLGLVYVTRWDEFCVVFLVQRPMKTGVVYDRRGTGIPNCYTSAPESDRLPMAKKKDRSRTVLSHFGYSRSQGARGNGSEWPCRMVQASASRAELRAVMGDAAKIAAMRLLLAYSDRQDARHILQLMVKDDFLAMPTKGSRAISPTIIPRGLSRAFFQPTIDRYSSESRGTRA